jgi:hypothetical protein
MHEKYEILTKFFYFKNDFFLAVLTWTLKILEKLGVLEMFQISEYFEYFARLVFT